MDVPQNGNKKLPEIPPTVLRLVIDWDQVSGALNVTGPINNTVIAFGMMEAAKDAIIKKKDAEARSIVAATAFPRVTM